jgi:hypothetical protein
VKAAATAFLARDFSFLRETTLEKLFSGKANLCFVQRHLKKYDETRDRVDARGWSLADQCFDWRPMETLGQHAWHCPTIAKCSARREVEGQSV